MALSTSTCDRKTIEKLQFILDNYGSLSKKEMAFRLNETPRWVKRQVGSLLRSGHLVSKNPFPDKPLTEEDWTPQIRARAQELRREYLKTNRAIAEILFKEFNLYVTPPAFQFWMDRFGISAITKKEWLREHISKEKALEMLNRGLRLVDVSKELENQYGVYVSDDLIAGLFCELSIPSYKKFSLKKVHEKIGIVSKDWLSDRIMSKVSVSEISRQLGVSSTVVHKRLRQENIGLVSRRKDWSGYLDRVTRLLEEAPPLDLPKDFLHQAMLGWLAGDGHVGHDGRFVLAHSVRQLDYFYVTVRILKRFITAIYPRPRYNTLTEDNEVYSGGGKDSFCLSCPGMTRYLSYLNQDGSKNLEKIYSELADFGWACYFMDDGSGGSTQIITMNKRFLTRFENRFKFGNICGGALTFKDVDQQYIIPGMAYKISTVSDGLGSFWRDKIPELFAEPTNELTLSFINPYVAGEYPGHLNKAVLLYQQQGFPFPTFSETYLRREYGQISQLRTDLLWADDRTVRFIDTGSYICKNFMPHIIEATFKGSSPKVAFEGFMSLRAVLEYLLFTTRRIMPMDLYDQLLYLHGVTGFPSGTAKALIEKFCPEGGIVVDPCSGWGGRFLGASSCGRQYVGFDPWNKTVKGLKAMSDFFSLEGTFFSAEFDPRRAPVNCSMVFTSPPFLDLEQYGERLTMPLWLELMRTIQDYAEKALPSGGYLLLNLPEALKVMLPPTQMEEMPSIQWRTTARSKDKSRTETIYAWRKK